jgi:hypothetical protein
MIVYGALREPTLLLADAYYVVSDVLISALRFDCPRKTVVNTATSVQRTKKSDVLSALGKVCWRIKMRDKERFELVAFKVGEVLPRVQTIYVRTRQQRTS